MTKFLFHRETGNKGIFDDDVNLADWPDYQETLPVIYKESESRHQRMLLLSDSDTWALTDRTMTDEQIQYRQALRDITTHANWPNLDASDWPIRPV